MKQYSIFEIADWFLSKASMTPKKLEKLTYYAEAWSNALYGKSLINDAEFEAWAHGPAAPTLYQQYKSYGWNMIPKKPEDETFDSQVLDLLESVWVTYGDKSANELEALTHSEVPWKKARKGLPEGASSQEKISKKDMKEYYRSIYNGD